MKSLVYLAAGLLALGLGFLSAQWWQQSQHADIAEASPAFELHDLNNQTHRLQDYQGKVLLLNFWATWCTPCRKEMPLLNTSYVANRERGFHILGPAIDDSAQISQFVDQMGIQYPVTAGGAELFSLMDALGDTLGALPFSVLINREGLIVERHWGELEAAQVQKWLDKYL